MHIKPILLSLKHNKFITLLMVIQIAFTMVTLNSAVLNTASTMEAWGKPSGIPHQDIVRISPRFYDQNEDIQQAMVRDVERAMALPNVVNIAPTYYVPMGNGSENLVYLSTEQDAEAFRTLIFESDHKLTDVLKLDLIEGRWLNQGDLVDLTSSDLSQRARQVMISQTMANEMFADSSAVGQTLWLEKQGDPVQVVGVYSDFMNGEYLHNRGRSYHSMIRPQVQPNFGRQMDYIIRVEAGTAEAMLDVLTETFYQERNRYINRTESLARVQKRMYDGRGSRALTMLAISIVLILITGLGITGLTSFQISQKRKHIGTRRALGAKRRDIMSYLLTENSIVTMVGLLLGGIGTIYITFYQSQQSAENLMNFSLIVLCGLVLWLLNLLAVWFPARQATKIAPSIVTRGG